MLPPVPRALNTLGLRTPAAGVGMVQGNTMTPSRNSEANHIEQPLSPFKVPIQAEAEALAQKLGGKVIRAESGHPAEGVSTHSATS